MRQAFEGLDVSAHPDRWDYCCKDGFYPWDQDGPSLALADLLTERSDHIPEAQLRGHERNLMYEANGKVSRRKALVPGCGLGHDVILLGLLGYDVIGLDCSQDAINMAEGNFNAAKSEGLCLPINGIVAGSIQFVAGDFFSEGWVSGLGAECSGKFHLIFDYTVCGWLETSSNFL
jgi:SAM-dependent methyltransferase